MQKVRTDDCTAVLSEKELEAAENEVYNICNETSPIGTDAGIL
jgi:hypothetical protein